MGKRSGVRRAVRAATTQSRTLLTVLCLFLVPFLGASKCGSHAGEEAAKRAAESIDRAVDQLAQQSSDWQQTLTHLQKELVQETQSTLANEVNNLMQRGIATGGNELRCNADFVGQRMRQGLQRIAARLRNQPIPPVEPAFCQVVPADIDLKLVNSGRLNRVDYFGYDMDLGSGVKVFLVDQSGEHEATQWMAMPTHYLLTINVSPTNGIRFPPTARQLAIRSGTKLLSTVNIVAAPTEPPPEPEVCTWLGWSCGVMTCPAGQHLAGIDFNATPSEGCWGRGNDMDEPQRRIRCCTSPTGTTQNSCMWSGWGCGIKKCNYGYYMTGVDFNATANERCWGQGNDFDEPDRRVRCCQAPSPPQDRRCDWSDWSCGAMECPSGQYITEVDFNDKQSEDCWGKGGDMDEPRRRIRCCPVR